MSQNTDELVWVDVARFFSSLAIVALHFYDNVPVAFKSEGTDSVISLLPHAVDLFFLISGFIISHLYYSRIVDWPSYRNFLVKRIARLIPLYYLSFAFFLVIGITYYAGYIVPNNPTAYDPACILPSLTLTQSLGFCGKLSFNYVSWSVGAEFLLYISFPLYPMIIKSRTILVLFVAAMICGLEIYWRQKGGIHWSLWTWNLGIARAIVGFSLGVLVYRLHEILARTFKGRRILIAIGLLIALVAASGLEPIFSVFAAYTLAIISIFARGGESAPAVRFFAYLGRLTYSMYMIHPMIQVVFLSIFAKRVLNANDGLMMSIVLIAVFVVIAAAQLSHLMFEQPMRKWIASAIAPKASYTSHT